MRKKISLLLFVAFTIAICVYVSQRKSSIDIKSIIKTDTIIRHDTLIYRTPIVKDSLIVKYRTAVLPVVRQDTITKEFVRTVMDSVEVKVPITQKVYEDSTYKAWVSGYEPQLDSIFVYQKTQVINHYIREKPKHWGIGLQIGYGCTGKELRPYIGIGVNYNIFRW
ncbi:hypothetical protein J5A56_00605 [Prevotella melaninogenica]|uniref:DUF6808 domain-containing protein n=1 Tax=Prevotella TaxID=838 RepID=UPI0003ACD942|nr:MULTISPECIES: hypothetical protein [Prevotella]ERJ80062.1 hypothetical protein HMPREF9148_00148 [Prevotella sp. F0091]QUB72935.1 hypothetical protein J5A56_00605 [Prevotella melaninogenica]